MKVLLKMQWIFVIFVSLFVLRNFRTTCSSVAMLKGYVVRKWLGIPGLDPSSNQGRNQLIFLGVGGQNHCNVLLYYFNGGGQNDCNLLLYLTIKHVFLISGVQLPGFPPGCGPASNKQPGNKLELWFC